MLNVLSLSGCHFHLRDQNTLPIGIHHIIVTSDSPYDNFTKQLKTSLALLNNSAQSTKSAQLIIHKHDLSYRMPIIGSSQQARIYQYIFTLEYSLKVNNTVLIDRKVISANKLLTLNKNALLTTNNQQNLLKIEIQQSVIRQLINELKSPLSHSLI